MAAQTSPIGVFDSGVGGLPIAAAIHELMPAESILYYADRAHFPYGSCPEAEVRDFAEASARFLIDRGAKLVVVACNTASSAALSFLRERFPVSFVGVVPGIKPGSLASGAAKVGVLATTATFQTKVFADLLEQFADGVEVHQQVWPDLVAMIDRGEVDSHEALERVNAHMRPLLEKGIDTLVLGCTHYAFLRPALQRVVGGRVTIVETALPVARQVGRVLERQGLLNRGLEPGEVTFYASADEERFRALVARLWRQAQLLCREEVA